jgi:hypothetical protein
VEELIEAKENKYDMENALVMIIAKKLDEEIVEEKDDFVRDAKHEHGKESETHYVDTHMDN